MTRPIAARNQKFPSPVPEYWATLEWVGTMVRMQAEDFYAHPPNRKELEWIIKKAKRDVRRAHEKYLKTK